MTLPGRLSDDPAAHLIRIDIQAMESFVMPTSQPDWQPSKAANGISFKTLRRDDATGGLTVLLRFEPGARFPAHRHPAGEEVFVVDGQVKIGNERLQQGDYLYAEPDSIHAVWTESGCTLLVMLPKPAEIVEKIAT